MHNEDLSMKKILNYKKAVRHLSQHLQEPITKIVHPDHQDLDEQSIDSENDPDFFDANKGRAVIKDREPTAIESIHNAVNKPN